MFITFPIWQVEGVPRVLLAPAIPWHSALLDVSQPCFLVAAQLEADGPQSHVRLFSDIDELLKHVREDRNFECTVHALSRIDNRLAVSKVTAIGSYPCPQTGIKLRVFFDDSEQPLPAHSGQPQFSSQLTFNIEARLPRFD